MNWTIANERLRRGLDLAFIAGVVFALVLAGKIVPFLIVAGVVPIPFLYRELQTRRLVVPPARLLVPAGIYFAYVLLAYFFFPGLPPEAPRPVNPDLELYGVGIAMLLVGLLRGLEIDGLRKMFVNVVPWALVAAFLVLSVLMFAGYRDACRVQAGAAWPFIPALLFTTLTFLSMAGWKDFSASQRNLRLALNACAIVVVLAYTASRGIALAEAGVIVLLLAMSFLPRFRGTVPTWKQWIVTLLAGAALCGVVSVTTGCGAGDRIIPLIRTIDILSSASAAPADAGPAPAAAAPAATTQDQAIMDADMSIGLRLEMWKVSVQAIREAPWFGHGALYLQTLITERFHFEHNHNQYLSWLVTGGVSGLAIGLLFLAIPWFVSAGLPLHDRLIITLAVSVFWGLAMMFDSYFNLKFYTHYYCLLCGLLYALVNDMVTGSQAEDRTS
jgi:O-antigen ligase